MVSEKNLKKDANNAPIRYSDDDALTQAELAQALRTSRWTIRKWMAAGYSFQYGNRTTARHCRKWLEANADKLRRKPKSNERMAAALRRMR
jgi:ABC-type proline/glycine betaine transport system substrate-binding protein